MLTTRTLSSTLDRRITLNRTIDQAFGASSRAWVPAIDVVEKKGRLRVVRGPPPARFRRRRQDRGHV